MSVRLSIGYGGTAGYIVDKALQPATPHNPRVVFMVDKPEQRDHESSSAEAGRTALSSEFLTLAQAARQPKRNNSQPEHPREAATRPAAATQPTDQGHPIDNSKLYDQMKHLQNGAQPVDVLKWAAIVHAMGDKPDQPTLHALEKAKSLPEEMSQMIHDNPALAKQMGSQDFQNYIQQQINKGFRGF